MSLPEPRAPRKGAGVDVGRGGRWEGRAGEEGAGEVEVVAEE